jgi:hypothetical protein
LSRGRSASPSRLAAFLTGRAAILAAALIYLLLTLVQGLFVPGLQYDEAIFAHGAIHMLHGSGRPTFNNPEQSWVRIGSQPVQLMVMEYAGAAKSYLLLPGFALFGGSVVVLRIVSVLLGAIGLAGVGLFVRWAAGGPAGFFTALLLAVHPGYIGWTAFDNTGLGIWMFGLALSLAALRRFIDRPALPSALLLGAAVGFAAWGRANVAWLAIAALAGALVAAPRPTLRLARWAPAGVAGAILGGFPLVLYLIYSRLGTFQFMSRMAESQGLVELLPERIPLAVQAAFYDAHRRWIWRGLSAPVWETRIILGVLLLSVVICLARPRWPRAVAVVLVLSVLLPFLSLMPLRPYHFVAYTPVAAMVVVLAARIAWERRWARPVVALLLVSYLSVAVAWSIAAGRGVRQNGGMGHWSNAIFSIAGHLQRHHPQELIRILDWGFGNSLIVLSNGALQIRESFWIGSPEISTEGIPWGEHVRLGGVFVAWADPHTRSISAGAFADALARAPGRRYTATRFTTRTGEDVAIVYHLPPEE